MIRNVALWVAAGAFIVGLFSVASLASQAGHRSLVALALVGAVVVFDVALGRADRR